MEQVIFNPSLSRLIQLQDRIELRKYIDSLIDNLLEIQTKLFHSQYIKFK